MRFSVDSNEDTDGFVADTPAPVYLAIIHLIWKMPHLMDLTSNVIHSKELNLLLLFILLNERVVVDFFYHSTSGPSE